MEATTSFYEAVSLVYDFGAQGCMSSVFLATFTNKCSCRLMHNQSWQYPAPADSCCPTGESSFWLWEGHPKNCAEPPVEAVEDAAAWALKSGSLQQKAGMRYANSSTPGRLEDQHQQQQFAEYWSRQDDRILSPYMPGFQCQDSRPHSSPALSIEPLAGPQEGVLCRRTPKLTASNVQLVAVQFVPIRHECSLLSASIMFLKRMFLSGLSMASIDMLSCGVSCFCLVAACRWL